MSGFQGNALPLTDGGVAAAANLLGVQPAEIWTVIAVETAGCGFWSDRTPQIRYERHVFSHLTHGQYDDGVISSPTPGGYPASGAPMYARLGQAMAKDHTAALESASWGIGQIMGENYAMCGFRSVDDMVAAMQQSEDAQLLAMANFIVSRKIAGALQGHNWAGYALAYNGTTYKQNQYDTKLATFYQKYSQGKLPDLNVRAAQIYLTYLGHHCSVDGDFGPGTMSALNQFETAQNVSPLSTAIDANTVALLSGALPAVG